MKNKNLFMGIILIVIGLLWTLSNFGIMNDNWILPIIGTAFLVAYLYRGGPYKKGTIGFLIAGSIISLIGLFSILSENVLLGSLEGSLFFFFLGTAFLLVYFIHTRHQIDDKPGNQKWPLVTGIIIILFGLFVLVTETAHIPAIRKIFRIGWPVALIVIGLFVMFRPGKKD